MHVMVNRNLKNKLTYIIHRQGRILFQCTRLRGVIHFIDFWIILSSNSNPTITWARDQLEGPAVSQIEAIGLFFRIMCVNMVFRSILHGVIYMPTNFISTTSRLFRDPRELIYLYKNKTVFFTLLMWSKVAYNRISFCPTVWTSHAKLNF